GQQRREQGPTAQRLGRQPDRGAGGPLHQAYGVARGGLPVDHGERGGQLDGGEVEPGPGVVGRGRVGLPRQGQGHRGAPASIVCTVVPIASPATLTTRSSSAASPSRRYPVVMPVATETASETTHSSWSAVSPGWPSSASATICPISSRVRAWYSCTVLASPGRCLAWANRWYSASWIREFSRIIRARWASTWCDLSTRSPGVNAKSAKTSASQRTTSSRP